MLPRLPRAYLENSQRLSEKTQGRTRMGVMIEKGVTSSEYRAFLIAAALFACQILGIDVNAIMIAFQKPEVQDLIEMVRKGHSGNEWYSNIAMFGAAGAYALARTSRKNKGVDQSNG
jgi:hypothetical protein